MTVTKVENTEVRKRHWVVAILLQIGIRLRYLWETWFGFRPIFMGVSGYKSPFRPKNCPE